MKYIGLFFAVLEPFKPTVRKTLLSDSVHVLSDITQQSHISITIILALVSHENLPMSYQRSYSFIVFDIINLKP